MGRGAHLAAAFWRSFLSQSSAIRKLALPPSRAKGGRMRFCVKLCVSMLAIAALFVSTGIPARAQDKQHVVSLSDLNKDAARPAQTRQSNDEDLAKLAERSRRAQSDFAAGRISDRDLLWIILIAIGIIVLVVALR